MSIEFVPLNTRAVVIDYTNYKGERASRAIVPDLMWWGSTPYHAEPQWLLRAYDFAKDAVRDFATKDIHSWRPATKADLPTEEETHGSHDHQGQA